MNGLCVGPVKVLRRHETIFAEKLTKLGLEAEQVNKDSYISCYQNGNYHGLFT